MCSSRGATQPTERLTLAAFDAATGETEWTKSFEGSSHSIHAANSYASGTPTVDAECVYVTWTANGVLHAAAVDHRGELAWQRELGPADYKHGSGNSPILVDDLLVIANDHTGDTFSSSLSTRRAATNGGGDHGREGRSRTRRRWSSTARAGASRSSSVVLRKALRDFRRSTAPFSGSRRASTCALREFSVHCGGDGF